MSILSWLKEATVGPDGSATIHTPAGFSRDDVEFHGLNMKNALDAHNQWTQRLEAQIDGSNSESLDIGTVASDTRCTLGRWIHSEAHDRFTGSEVYEELKRIHAEFHLACGKVLNDAYCGDSEAATHALKSVRYRSGEVQLALIRFYEKHR